MSVETLESYFIGKVKLFKHFEIVSSDNELSKQQTIVIKTLV